MNPKRRPSKEHHIKCCEPYFAYVRHGIKTFEIRFDDRDYQEGDRLVLYKCDEAGNLDPHSVRLIRAVTYILSSFHAVMPGYVVMGIAPDLRKWWKVEFLTYEEANRK